VSAAGSKNRSYVQVATEELQHYAQGLLRENQRLREKTAALESEQQQVRREAAQARSALLEIELVRRAAESLEAQKAEILAECTRLQRERDASIEEVERIRVKFVEIEEENQRYAEQYQQIEHHSSNLANLYVASYQLHSSVERQTVLQSILEIVINLIGSEEVAIFEAGAGSDEFHLSSSFGIEREHLVSFTSGTGPIGRRVASGETFVADSGRGDVENPTACIPLKIGGSIIGAIVVFRLLEHKQSLEQVDHELFEVLAIHAATALHCATLHERHSLVAVA
jgi:GAF domain